MSREEAKGSDPRPAAPGRTNDHQQTLARTPGQSVAETSARLLVISLVAVVILLWTYATWTGKFGPFLGDIDAYWNAGERLRLGQGLYPHVANDTAASVFRYSPWFAYAWVPLTLLPRWLVNVAWVTALVLGSAYSIRHLLDRQGILVAAFLGTTLCMAVQAGNVHPLLIAILVRTVGTRLAPLGIAAAASLKAFPILLIVVFVARRDWRAVIQTLALAAVFVSPLVAQDFRNYTIAPERTLSLISVNPVLWASIAVAAAAAALRLAHTRFRWLAAAVLVIAALPRVILYDFSYLLVGTRRDIRADSPGQSTPP